MLIGVPPLLGPDFLSVLRGMGHGDEIAIVDGNYPAAEHARRLVRADGLYLPAVLDAMLQVLPVDDFVPHALFRSTVGGDPDALNRVHEEMLAICARRAPGFAVVPLVGEAFYGRVRAAHAVVATSEPRLYANFIVRKGVIHPVRESDA
ncbi:MAG: transporter [Rhizobiaceae bacterium]|nr:MAG: transporter [Rhizobiaceae bacterium]CAG0989587.1 L-fucose mutarotase [Rhizobiaceae bacterium]